MVSRFDGFIVMWFASAKPEISLNRYMRPAATEAASGRVISRAAFVFIRKVTNGSRLEITRSERMKSVRIVSKVVGVGVIDPPLVSFIGKPDPLVKYNSPLTTYTEFELAGPSRGAVLSKY